MSYFQGREISSRYADNVNAMLFSSSRPASAGSFSIWDHFKRSSSSRRPRIATKSLRLKMSVDQEIKPKLSKSFEVHQTGECADMLALNLKGKGLEILELGKLENQGLRAVERKIQ